MSELSKKELEQMAAIGSVLIAKLSKEELCTLSLVHDCGTLDTIMDKEVNPQVVKDFPELFVMPEDYPDIQEVSKEEYEDMMDDSTGRLLEKEEGFE